MASTSFLFPNSSDRNHDQSIAIIGNVLRQGDEPKEAIENLLQRDYSPTLLFYCSAMMDLVPCMEVLVSQYKVKVNCKIPVKGVRVRPLSVASDNGNVLAMEWLLEHGAKVEARTEMMKDGGTFTPLFSACKSGHVRAAKLLLDHGADIDTTKSSTGNTALYIATQNGHLPVVQLLLQRGAMLDKIEGEGVPPAVMAVNSARLDILALFLNYGSICLRDDSPVQSYIQGMVKHMKKVRKTLSVGRERKLGDAELASLELLLENGNNELRQMPNYRKAQVHEHAAEYRKALYYLSRVKSEFQAANETHRTKAIETQLKFDEQRLFQAVYGVKGCDFRSSVWNRHLFYDTDIHPPPLNFCAWTHDKIRNKIYRHGGVLNFTGPSPQDGDLWEFDIATKQWSLVQTKGSVKPGPRTGHCAVIHNDILYLFGGRIPDQSVDMKIYKLDLKTLRWDRVKPKGMQPDGREEFACCVYKDMLYLYGGRSHDVIHYSDLWSFSFATSKWKLLSENGGTERNNHGMWAAHNKLYVFGGQNFPDKRRTGTFDEASMAKLERFDIETSKWESLPTVGDDPWEIMEFTVVPLYYGEEEPSSIIIFGGYSHRNRTRPAETMKEAKEKYADELQDYLLPYRRRLLRFDLETLTFTKLSAMRDTDVMPTALSFGAELETENGLTHVLIGGGYGLKGAGNETKDGAPLQQMAQELAAQADIHLNVGQSVTPQIQYDVFEVGIRDDRGSTFAENCLNGIGWEWEFLSNQHKARLSAMADALFGSPTIHCLVDVCEGDFSDPPEHPVRENDETTMLGRIVVLQGLKGRADLNGCHGRCGFWLRKTGRYEVLLFESAGQGRRSISVKAANLGFTPRLISNELSSMLFDDKGAQKSPMPTILGVTCSGGDYGGNVFEPLPKDSEDKGNLLTDTYRGPLSARAYAVARSVAAASDKSMLTIARLPLGSLREATRRGEQGRSERLEQALRYEMFLKTIRTQDEARVELFGKQLVSARDETKWGEWLTLNITIDGLGKHVERVVYVSPKMSMRRLHHQVLSPSIGWMSNFHAYAFRRIHSSRLEDGTDLTPEQTRELLAQDESDFRDKLQNECWIGPRVSSALDTFFQPLYIGGAMVDDRKVCLGDLFNPKDKSGSKIQYVHDFGDWWSHTIVITKQKKYDDIPEDAKVAHLVSGRGACPAEDTGGIMSYAQTLAKLTGASTIQAGDGDGEYEPHVGQYVEPTNEVWWHLLNKEIRAKSNALTFECLTRFDIEFHRAELANALRRRLPKIGTECRQLIHRDAKLGLSSTQGGAGGTKPEVMKTSRDPTKFCPVCGVTAALQLCSACHSIAFCSREHQLEYWPKHKAACKAAQKKRKSSRK